MNPRAKKAPPPPPGATPTNPTLPPIAGPPVTDALAASVDQSFAVTSGRRDMPQKVLLYGTGGVGKTTLASLIEGAVFLDVEAGSNDLDVNRIEDIGTFGDLRRCLQSPVVSGFGTVIVDTATKVDEMAEAHTLLTVPHEKGHLVKSLENYGYGKGYQHKYDKFMLFLADLDRQIRAGRNVVLIAHDCINDVPNPVGDDFIRYEPHLQAPRSGKASIRNRVIQWADHVLFLGYDVISEDGKGKGGGTRTLWPIERPDHIAKSRRITTPMAIESATDGAIWQQIFTGGN